MKITEQRLRRLIRKCIVEALSDWNPEALPQMFNAVFQKHAVLRNDPQVEPFSTRGGPMLLSFEALRRAARLADQIAAGSPEEVEPLRVEASSELETAREYMHEILDAVGGQHRGVQDVLSRMTALLSALDPAEYADVPAADVGDLYEPL